MIFGGMNLNDSKNPYLRDYNPGNSKNIETMLIKLSPNSRIALIKINSLDDP